MDLVYFLLLVGPLIFVHELGHFLAAKAFGVKVLVFSLGFGPKLLRIRGRETEYCLGLWPLGGYVKMLEEARSDEVTPEDRHRTFERQPLWQRIVVVLAGPVMNLVFPIVLYFGVFVGDGPYLPPTVGGVLPGHPADGILLPGDRIMSVNGREIGTFDEWQRIVMASPGRALRITVFRENRHVDVEVVPREEVRRRELDIEERVGTAGVLSSAPAAVIGVADTDSPAWRAGLRTFDIVTHVAGQPVRRFMDLERALTNVGGTTVPVAYLRPVRVRGALGGLAELSVYDAGVVALTPEVTGTRMVERTGIESADLYAAVVPEDSYLAQAGVRVGDRIVALDGEEVPAWSTFQERVLAAPGLAHQVEWLSVAEARRRSGVFEIRVDEGASGDQRSEAFALSVRRVRNWQPLAPEERVDHPSPIPYAFDKALTKTLEVTTFIGVAFLRLLEGRLSLDSLSGPITIYEVAGQEGRKGAGHLIWVMAVLSVNLGLLNLLPIPLLDGGHLFFFLVEGVTRRPVPFRVREIAHVVGFLLLLTLIALAFKNDVERRWDVIVGHLKELTG